MEEIGDFTHVRRGLQHLSLATTVFREDEENHAMAVVFVLDDFIIRRAKRLITEACDRPLVNSYQSDDTSYLCRSDTNPHMRQPSACRTVSQFLSCGAQIAVLSEGER